MAVTESFIQVAPDSTGKKMETVRLTTAAGEVEREVVSVGDPETAGARQKVSNALPAPTDFGAAVRDVAPGYDSGITTLPAALTAITTDTIRAIGILLCNLTTTKQKVTLTNTAGSFYLNEYELQRNMTEFKLLGRATMVGAKWNAGSAPAVNAQLVGEK